MGLLQNSAQKGGAAILKGIGCSACLLYNLVVKQNKKSIAHYLVLFKIIITTEKYKKSPHKKVFK